MNIKRIDLNLVKNVSFSGHKKKQDATGCTRHNFYYLYDKNKYKCELELYNINIDKNLNLSLKDERKPARTFQMENGAVELDMSDVLEIDSSKGFAYRFKLTNRNNANDVSYAFDNGTVIGLFDNVYKSDNKYNVILSNRATINKNGPMQLIMPDGYNPDIHFDSVTPAQAQRNMILSNVRNHANKLGGKFSGIIERLPQIEAEGIARIVGTPFTKDSISSHLYWTENAYQISPNLGTFKDYEKLQVELFKHGINWIADAALVNEGLGGVHVSEMLRKGDDSSFKNMFRTDERISLGMIPDDSTYTRIKLVNAPFTIEKDGKTIKDNPNYTTSKPTFVQLYDDRLASRTQKTDDKLITEYENKTTGNAFDITKHDDAVYPYSVEVNPSELIRNYNMIKKNNSSVDFTDVDTIQKLLNFSNFSVVTKSKSGGMEVWDGNVDIAKLNFYYTKTDEARFEKYSGEAKEKAIDSFQRGNYAARDYALTSGKYWTKLTSDIQMKYISQLLSESKGNITRYTIKDLVEKNQLPKIASNTVTAEVIQNVQDDNYVLNRLDFADMRADINPEGSGNDYSLNDYVLRKSMELPLETLPVANNLLGILTSPYIAKKANTSDEIGITRYDLHKAGNPNLPAEYLETYSEFEEIYGEISSIVSQVVDNISGTKEGDEVSEYGKYVVSEIAPELTKYLLVKSLDLNADIKVDVNGEIDFSKVDSSKITMQSLGIPYSGLSSKEEAKVVIKTIGKNLQFIKAIELDELKTNIENRFKNRKLIDFKMAEMIIDRTESGLGWRIDAAKDVASIDAVRSGDEDMNNAWLDVIDFWKSYNQEVLKENPHAYTTAEITDLADLFAFDFNSKFMSDADAERKFLEATGITSVANYNYFFSLLPQLYNDYNADENSSSWMFTQNQNKILSKKLDEGWSYDSYPNNPGFLFQSPADGIKNSYTFVDNHDKPRMLHSLAVDMLLFHSDFSDVKHRDSAAAVLGQDDVNKIDFTKVNSMAIAMGECINNAIDKIDENTKKILKDAVKDLANGSYKGKEFDPTAFGTRPFEVAIEAIFDQADYKGFKFDNEKELKANILKNILNPAFDKFYSIYKLLIALPGSPTEFAGDKVGASGYESKAKNYHQQNRNAIHWEWLKDDSAYSFVKNFYNKMNEISNLRTKEELSALNDGDTISIPTGKEGRNKYGERVFDRGNQYQAFMRYNDKGSVVLCINALNNKKDQNIEIDNINLNIKDYTAKQGLKHGLEVGTQFKNVRPEDTAVYEVVQKGDMYVLEKHIKDENNNNITKKITFDSEDFNTLILYKC